MTRWARAMVFAVGCGHAAPPSGPAAGTTHAAAPASDAQPAAPKPLEDDLPRLATRAVAMFQAWAHALADAHDDCPAATRTINQLAIDFADVIAANQAIARAGHAKVVQLREELAKHDEDMDSSAQAIAHSSTMSHCAGDAQFAAAIDRLGGEPP